MSNFSDVQTYEAKLQYHHMALSGELPREWCKQSVSTSTIEVDNPIETFTHNLNYYVINAFWAISSGIICMAVLYVGYLLFP